MSLFLPGLFGKGSILCDKGLRHLPPRLATINYQMTVCSPPIYRKFVDEIVPEC